MAIAVHVALPLAFLNLPVPPVNVSEPVDGAQRCELAAPSSRVDRLQGVPVRSGQCETAVKYAQPTPPVL